MDNISLLYNFEGGIVTKDAKFSQALISIWNEDLKKATFLTLDEHRSRPLIQKIYTLIIYPFRKLL